MNDSRYGELIQSVRGAIEQIGAGNQFNLSDVMARLPEDCGDRRQAIASMINKRAHWGQLVIAVRARGARRSSFYVWPGSWPIRLSMEDRFWSKVNKNGPVIRPELGPCWPWIGKADSNGYGRFGADWDVDLAHRVSWRLTYGEIPIDICVLHRCDNPPCVRPVHLFLGDRGDNARDMAAKGRQHVQRNPAAMPRCPAEKKARGERSGMSRFTDADILQMRNRFAAGERRVALAREFDTSISHISMIVKGQLWRHVGGPILEEHS